MNNSIVSYLKREVRPHMAPKNDIVEIGSLDVNGSAWRTLHRNRKVSTWIGLDRVPGPGVNIVTDAKQWLDASTKKFDMIVACECYEHDPKWWLTNDSARNALKPGGLYVVTTPGISFPFHDFGGDFYRFTEMAFRDVIFEGFEVINITTAEPKPTFTTVMGFARKPQ